MSSRQRLEQQGTHTPHLRLLLDKDLEVLVDDCDGQQDTSAGSGKDLIH